MALTTFTDNTKIKASEINSNFSGLADGTEIAANAITAAKIAATAGPSSLASAWASWTPTWTNLTVGNGTVTAKYIQVGKIVYFRLKITFGSTSSISGAVGFSLPATANSEYGGQHIWGMGRILDDGSATYDAVVGYSSTTVAAVNVWNVSGTYLVQTALSSTVPMTWTTNDSFSAQGFYEAA